MGQYSRTGAVPYSEIHRTNHTRPADLLCQRSTSRNQHPRSAAAQRMHADSMHTDSYSAELPRVTHPPRKNNEIQGMKKIATIMPHFLRSLFTLSFPASPFHLFLHHFLFLLQIYI